MSIAEPFITAISDVIASVVPALGGWSWWISLAICALGVFVIYMQIINALDVKGEHMGYVYVFFPILLVVVGIIPAWIIMVVAMVLLAILFYRNYIGSGDNGQ